jgi:hypothetical protein
MESEGSLLCSQQHTNGPYPQQIDTVHTFTLYVFPIHFNTVLPSTVIMNPKQSTPLHVSQLKLCTHFSDPSCMFTFPTHFFDFIALIIFEKQ